MTEQYSFEEISKHTSDDDCWIVIHGKVYNVTDFLDAHPGGPEYLTDFSGSKNATEQFEDFGHSKAARDMLKDYLIGTVHPDDVDKFGDNSKAKTDSGSSDNPSWIAAVIGILAVVVALYLKFGQSE